MAPLHQVRHNPVLTLKACVADMTTYNVAYQLHDDRVFNMTFDKMGWQAEVSGSQL